MDPDVAFFSGIIASAVWQRDHIAGIKVDEADAVREGEVMVLRFPHLSGKTMKVTIEAVE